MRYLIGFALLLPMVVFAQDPPLPESLLNAKTAFVEKVGIAEESFNRYCKAPQINAGAKDKNLDKFCKSLKEQAKTDKQLFDRFCKELNKWGRFALVQTRSSADVRILLGRTLRNSRIMRTSSGNTAPVVGADSPPSYIGDWASNLKIQTTTYDGKTYGMVNGKIYSIDTSPVYTAPRQNVTANSSLQLVASEEILINIRNGRNDVLLYLDKTGGPGKLVSNLKKKMQQK
jgi:hypothetical protein